MSNIHEHAMTTIRYNIPAPAFLVVISLCAELQNKCAVTTILLDNSNIDIRFKDSNTFSDSYKKITGTYTEQFIVFAKDDVEYFSEHLPKLSMFLKTVEIKEEKPNKFTDQIEDVLVHKILFLIKLKELDTKKQTTFIPISDSVEMIELKFGAGIKQFTYTISSCGNYLSFSEKSMQELEKYFPGIYKTVVVKPDTIKEEPTTYCTANKKSFFYKLNTLVQKSIDISHMYMQMKGENYGEIVLKKGTEVVLSTRFSLVNKGVDVSISMEDMVKLNNFLPGIEYEILSKEVQKVDKPDKESVEAKPVIEDRGTHYRFTYKGVHLDPARIAMIYGITNPMQFQALKKILCAGKRGHKDTNADIKDIACAVNRWQELLQDE